MKSEDVIKHYELRTRLLTQVWDEERTSLLAYGGVAVLVLFDQIGEGQSSEKTRSHLLRTLLDDGLIESLNMPADAAYPPIIKLTPAGRNEIERWIVSNQATEHLILPVGALPTDAYIRIQGGQVDGSAFMAASPGATVTINNNYYREQVRGIADLAKNVASTNATAAGTANLPLAIAEALEYLMAEGESGLRSPDTGGDRTTIAIARVNDYITQSVGDSPALRGIFDSLMQAISPSLPPNPVS